MKYNTSKGVCVSELSLGTVQLGVSYGINNQSGKPNQSQTFDILNTALRNGITALDTAAAYGDSEQVIGHWLKTIPQESWPFISTKLKALDHSSLDAMRKSVNLQLEHSMQQLGLDCIPLLMLHNFDEYDCDRENMRIVFDELKQDGKIRFSGISAYAHHDYRVIASSGFDAVQIPLNIFDWRQIDNGGLDALRTSGMMVFVRSVYLQGLVFQKPEQLDARMNFARDTLTKFHALCAQYALSPAELALSFALSLPGVTSLVLGSETAEQVQQNVDLLSCTPRLNESQLKEIHMLFRDVPERLLSPSEWFNAQKEHETC